MFAKFLTLFTLALAATAVPTNNGQSSSDSNLQCCSTLLPGTTAGLVQFLGLLGVEINDVQIANLVGLGCRAKTPEDDCDPNENTAECEYHSSGKLIALNCIHVLV